MLEALTKAKKEAFKNSYLLKTVKELNDKFLDKIKLHKIVNVKRLYK